MNIDIKFVEEVLPIIAFCFFCVWFIALAYNFVQWRRYFHRPIFRKKMMNDAKWLAISVAFILTSFVPSLLPRTTLPGTFSIAEVAPYQQEPSIQINGNLPYFTEEEISLNPLEIYGDLDLLGRCTTTMALLSNDTLTYEPRGSIGMIQPSGWHTVRYDGLVDQFYLYNRCHLIGYQLTGQNANEKNLITGTRYLNVNGMLPYENQVAQFIRDTNMHVLYRVTPIFDGSDLLASGVLMEAYSVEDQGVGLSFCVYCYNVQPGIVIDYQNGDSHRA